MMPPDVEKKVKSDFNPPHIPPPEKDPAKMPDLTPLQKLLFMHAETGEKCREIMKKKNHDYTSGSSDPYANFRASLILDIEPELGILLRCQDKFMRMKSFLTVGLKVDDETVEDACDDVINYMMLIKGLFRERKEEPRRREERIKEYFESMEGEEMLAFFKQPGIGKLMDSMGIKISL